MLKKLTICAVCVASAAIGLTFVASQTARAQSSACTWYADTALKQQQQNEQRKCGFKGPEWSTSRQTHLTWCATQSTDTWKAVAQQREKQLAACK
jgi:hypothetical protein